MNPDSGRCKDKDFGMDIRITQAVATDATAISKLILPLAAKYIIHEFPLPARQKLLDSMNPDGIEKLMRSGCVYHLAYKHDKLVGIVGIKQCSHLYHMFVDELYQCQGIARMLWKTAMQQCLDAGAGGEFSVNASRYALPVYERLGFVSSANAQERNGIVTFPMVFKPR